VATTAKTASAAINRRAFIDPPFAPLEHHMTQRLHSHTILVVIRRPPEDR
jgi:hypothetical protein